MRVTVTTTDIEEGRRLIQASDLCSFIWNFQCKLHKYWDNEDLSKISADDLIDKLQIEWHEQLEEDDINLNKLWS